jgi:crotonobetainyl-CoA:carnitine CoA-transferase CaiB-like acyl-CoA transferase
MPGPLAGVRIVELSQMISAPMAVGILADQGADVIKVEPLAGDRLRVTGFGIGGLPALFANINRGKRSLALDLRQARARELLLRLVERADVFVQNYRPGVMEQMGLGEAELRARRPELIYVSISGFGEAGPYAQRRVIDSAMQAISGVAASQAEPGSDRPRLIQNTYCDKATAWIAAQAISAALFARERGAGGQHLRLSLLDASIAFLWPDAMQGETYYLEGDEEPPTRAGYLDLLRYADGWLAISAVTQVEFEAVCRGFGREDVLTDPKLATVDGRARHLGYLVERLQEMVAGRSREELVRILDAADICYGLANGLDRVADDPQVRFNQTVVDLEQPVRKSRTARPPARFSGTPAELRGGAPLTGQHTASILAELGLGAPEIEELRATGAVK